MIASEMKMCSIYSAEEAESLSCIVRNRTSNDTSRIIGARKTKFDWIGFAYWRRINGLGNETGPRMSRLIAGGTVPRRGRIRLRKFDIALPASHM
jgi:hypothetical protein